MTNIEMQAMNAVCAIPRALKDISDKLDKLDKLGGLGGEDRGESVRTLQVRDNSDGTVLGYISLSGKPALHAKAIDAIVAAFSDLSKDGWCEWDDILDAARKGAGAHGCEVKRTIVNEVYV